MKRCFDLLLALAAGAILLVPCLLIALAVRLTSRGPALYWSERVGRNEAMFLMPKFRSMFLEAPVVPTDQLADPSRWITPIGGVLRRTSLDELPQLWSILKGDMSFVGPRPALFNQHDLIARRRELGIDRLRPGLTGWAQVNGRDEIPLDAKVAYDAHYLAHCSLGFDVKILALTALKVLRSEGVAH
jgi:O-antigen biosynthesis protein WbqP